VKEEIEQSQKELKRCNNRLNEYNNSIQLINKFKWEKKEVEALKNEISAYFTKIEDKDRQIGEEEDKYEKYETDKIKMTDEKNHIENVSLLNLRKEYAEYKKYLEKENDYQNSIKELAENKAQRDFFVRRINEIKRLLDENKDLINHIKDELNNLTQYITSMHKEYLLVEDVEERKIKKGTINELQAEKSELEKKSNGDVQECKNKIADEKKDIESLKREVSRLKVDIKDCRGIPYAETELNESEYRIEDLQRAIENISDELSEYNGEKDKKIGNIETKTEQLKGKPLLDPENIGGNFTERLQDLNVEKNYTLQRLDDVADERGLIENKSNELRLVLPEQAKYKNVEKLPFNEETDVQKALSTIDELILKYKRKKKENKVLLSNFERLYQRTREKYENKNKEISDALDSLRGQFAQIKRDAELDQKEYEYYFDMSLNIDRLRTLFDEYIKKLKGQLGELENATKELNEIIYKQTIRVFNEIPKIVENSTISIDGESQRMIEIKFDRNLDHNISRDSLFNYLSDCMNKVVAELSSGEKETKVKERIHKYIKMEELLNTISNLDKYQVKMYKVDANPYNRKMKRWKDMKSKDSGGERFVAFFCLLLALTSYGRQGMLEDTKLLKENSSKVLIMDNPFGTITSDHLLKPLFAFAKKHRTQLICLTDIDKASIMNNFDLIYSITIRQKLSDNNELVRFEEKNSGDLKENKNLISLLEQISLQLKTEQINMFK
jgi:chromosome segregation ATPase